DAHLLARLQLRPLRLELQVAGRDDELALGVDETQLDLLGLADVLRSEAETGDHGERGAAGQLRQLQCAEATTQHVELPVGRRDAHWVRPARMGCNQQHQHGPIDIVYPDGVSYGRLAVDDINEIIDEHLVGGRPVERLRIVPDGPWSATALT